MRWRKKISAKKLVTVVLSALFFAALSLNLLLGNTLHAQPTSTGISMASQVAKLIFAVGLIVVLIYLTLLFLNKFMYRRTNFNGQLQVKVVGTTPLGPKKFIYLVEVFDRLLVLGVTDNQISNLTEIADTEILNQIKSAPEKAVHGGKKRSFQSQLEGLLKRS